MNTIWTPVLPEGRYRDMVLKAKDYITAGDIFQVVLSQRTDIELNADPFDFYRVLRQPGVGFDHHARAFLALAAALRYEAEAEAPFLPSARLLLDVATLRRADLHLVLGLQLERVGHQIPFLDLVI